MCVRPRSRPRSKVCWNAWARDMTGVATPCGRRIFLACFPPASVAERICDVGEAIVSDGRLLHPNQIHLTLAFLGNQPGSVVDALQHTARRHDLSGGCLRLERAGYFQRPAIAWLGPARTPDFLGELAAHVETVCHRAGVAMDGRRWRPHVSVARKTTAPRRSLLASPINWEIDSFELCESHLSKTGSVYNSLGRWPLRPGRSEASGRV